MQSVCKCLVSLRCVNIGFVDISANFFYVLYNCLRSFGEILDKRFTSNLCYRLDILA